MQEPDLDDLAARFVARTIPPADWTHTAHLAVGFWHVVQYGADEAVARMRLGIKRLNDSHGTPNSATRGYHETITRAYLELIREFHAACPSALPVSARFEQLLSTGLADRNVLLVFYTRDRLMSESARAEWVEPDLAPLKFTNIAERSPGSLTPIT